MILEVKIQFDTVVLKSFVMANVKNSSDERYGDKFNKRDLELGIWLKNQ